MFDLENHEESRWKNRKSLLEMRLSIALELKNSYEITGRILWATKRLMWINLPRSTGATLLALWCHPIHYPAFEMKFEVKNNQTNETEFYVKRWKPSQFKYQHFCITLNETRLCLSLARLCCHAIRSISKNRRKLGVSGSRNENDFKVAFSKFICSLKVCGHFSFFKQFVLLFWIPQ